MSSADRDVELAWQLATDASQLMRLFGFRRAANVGPDRQLARIGLAREEVGQ